MEASSSLPLIPSLGHLPPLTCFSSSARFRHKFCNNPPLSQGPLSQLSWRTQQWGHSQHRSALLLTMASAVSGSSSACRDLTFHPAGPVLRLPSPRYSLLQGPVSGSVLTRPWRPGFQPGKSWKRTEHGGGACARARLPRPRTAASELGDSVGAQRGTLFGKPAR